MTMETVYDEVADKDLNELRDEFGPNTTERQEIEVYT